MARGPWYGSNDNAGRNRTTTESGLFTPGVWNVPVVNLATSRLRWRQAGTIDMLVQPKSTSTEIRFISRFLFATDLLLAKVPEPAWFVPVGFAPGVVADWPSLTKASNMTGSSYPHESNLGNPTWNAMGGYEYYVPPTEFGTVVIETTALGPPTTVTLEFPGRTTPLLTPGSITSPWTPPIVPYVILMHDTIDSSALSPLSDTLMPVVGTSWSGTPSWIYDEWLLGKSAGWSTVSPPIELPVLLRHMSGKSTVLDVTSEYTPHALDSSYLVGLPPPFPLLGFETVGDEGDVLKELIAGNARVYRLGHSYLPATRRDRAYPIGHEFHEALFPCYVESLVDITLVGLKP